jgi:hypothetical protein
MIIAGAKCGGKKAATFPSHPLISSRYGLSRMLAYFKKINEYEM